MADNPTIGEIRTDKPLFLRACPNGGWVVSQKGEDLGHVPNEIGAYSSAQEMLEALHAALVTEPQKEEGEKP